MKYSIELRMKNPGPAKYLIETLPANTINEAFEVAAYLCDRGDQDYFVQVRDESNEVIANFGLAGVS